MLLFAHHDEGEEEEKKPSRLVVKILWLVQSRVITRRDENSTEIYDVEKALFFINFRVSLWALYVELSY